MVTRSAAHTYRWRQLDCCRGGSRVLAYDARVCWSIRVVAGVETSGMLESTSAASSRWFDVRLRLRQAGVGMWVWPAPMWSSLKCCTQAQDRWYGRMKIEVMEETMGEMLGEAQRSTWVGIH